MAAPRQLVSVDRAAKSFGAGTVLDDVSLGVAAGERIGVVGANGAGKSTLLSLVARLDTPDTGQVTWTTDLRVGMLGQIDALDPAATIRQEVIGGLADHEWAGDRRIREVLDGTIGGVAISRFPEGLDTVIGPLSGGERRRIALAKLLLDGPELLLLDEPTNHLDLEAVGWLAGHLAARRGRARRRDPRSLVPRHRLLEDVGDRRRHGARARRWVRRVGARTSRARSHRRGQRGEAPEPPAQGARMAPARPARAHDQAPLPHRRGERPDRGRARRAQPRRAAALRERAAREVGARRRGREPDAGRPAAAAARHLAPRPGRPRRARRRQRIGQDDAPAAAVRRARADAGRGAHGLDRPPRHADPGSRGARRRPARARVARGRAHPHRARRRPRADGLAAVRALRLRREPPVDVRRRPLGR